MKYTFLNDKNLEEKKDKLKYSLYLNIREINNQIILSISKKNGDHLLALSDINYDNWCDFFETEVENKPKIEIKNEPKKTIKKKNVEGNLFNFLKKQ